MLRPPRPRTQKKTSAKLTPSAFDSKRIYPKIRRVFPYGVRGEQKMEYVSRGLGVEESRYTRQPKLGRTLTDEDVDETLDRLEETGKLSQSEAQKVRDILDEDMHPGER